MKVFGVICLLFAGCALSEHGASAQVDPMEYFQFDPQVMVNFLLASLRPEYENKLKDIQVLGNTSAYLVEFANRFFPGNLTNEFITSKLGQSILDAIDTEMLNLFRNMNLQTADIGDLVKQLMKFNGSEIISMVSRELTMRVGGGFLTNSTRTVISKLERDESIAGDLHPLVAFFEVGGMNVTDFTAKLDVSLRQLTKKLMAGSKWSGMSDFEKLRTIFTNFDYRAFGKSIISPMLQRVDNSLSANQTLHLAKFIRQLNESQAVELRRSLEEGVQLANESLKANNMSLPSFLHQMDFNSLQLLHVFEVIEEFLHQAVTDIKLNKASNDTWMDKVSVTNTERLALVLTNVNYTAIGQRIMGNVLDVIGEEPKLQNVTQLLLKEVFEMMNLTNGNGQVIDDIAAVMAAGLRESWERQVMVANWTQLTNSSKLMILVNNMEWRSVTRKLVLSIAEHEMSLLSPEMIQNITAVVQAVEMDDRQKLMEMFNDQMDKLLAMMWSRPQPSFSASMNQVVSAEIVNQLLQIHYVLDNANTTIQLANNTNVTFSQLSDPQKLALLVLSANNSIIGQVAMNETLEIVASHMLSRLSGNEPALLSSQEVENLLHQVPFVTSNITTTIINFINSTALQLMRDDFNKQVKEKYAELSSNTTAWANNSTSRQKLMRVLEHYDVMSTVDVAMVEFLKMVDEMIRLLPVNRQINALVERMKQRQSIGDYFETLRKEMNVSTISLLRYVTQDTLTPLYKYLDSQLSGLTEEQFNKWMTTPGQLPKIYKFIRLLNHTKFVEAQQQVVARFMMSEMGSQLVPGLPKSYRAMMVEAMHVIESGALELTLNSMLVKAGGDNFMMKLAANSSLVKAVVNSISTSILTTYESTRRSSDAEWRLMSAEEKLLRVMSRIDVSKVMQDALLVIEYIMSPKYQEECSIDLASVQHGLSQGMAGMWAIKLVDAWGKLPAGLLNLRFTWPGDMDECEKARGDRVKVDSSTGQVTVLKKEGVKGAWSMANIEVPFASAITFGQKPQLNWGICLPASCDYSDTLKFMKRLEVVGVKVKYLKPRSLYPAFSGEYSKDSKFIGVSFFFAFILTVVVVSSCIDKMVLRKREKCTKNKELAMKPLSPQLNGKPSEKAQMYEVTTYNGGVKAHDNPAYEPDADLPGKMATGDLEGAANGHAIPMGEARQEKKHAPKPGVGVQLLKAFSLYENLPKLLDASNKPNQLKALDGIRFLSMTWVIIGHVYALVLNGLYVQNMGAVGSWGGKGDWTFMGISGGLFAVDSFFLLSGLLVGYLFLKTLDKVKGKISCMTMTLYYVHRYLRLLPLYAGVLMIIVAYSNYIGTGPLNFWFSEALKNPCDSNWWTNLLYINNVYKEKEMCAGVTWYLANDMQFYVIAPFLLIPLYWSPAAGLSLIGALFAGHLGVTGWLWGKRSGGSQFTDQGVFMDIYIKPWCRIGPYLIGLVLGFMLFKKIKVKSRVLQGIWWLISLGLIALVIYIPYDSSKENGLISSSWNSTQRAVYETLCKNAWALALGWIVFAANTGCAGFIGDVLSWGGWAPLSRLTFAAYLLHPIVQEVNYKNRHNLVHLDHISLIYMDLAVVSITYLAAVVLHLLLEAPMAGIEKVLLPRK